jgi:hypothetical protein
VAGVTPVVYESMTSPTPFSDTRCPGQPPYIQCRILAPGEAGPCCGSHGRSRWPCSAALWGLAPVSTRLFPESRIHHRYQALAPSAAFLGATNEQLRPELPTHTYDQVPELEL